MPAVDEQLAAAISLHQAGRLHESEQKYRQILSVEPNHAAAWHHLGVTAIQMGNREAAERYIKRALELQPLYPEAYCNLGLVLRSQGKHDEAVACLREALKLKPDFADANCGLGTVLLDKGKWDEAAASLRRALELKPDHALAFIGLGTALEHQGDLDEAVVCFRRGLELQPDCAQGHNNLGSALSRQGKLHEAIASYRCALDHKPECVETRLNLGSALQDSGLLEEAIDCYRQALELNPVFADALSNLGTAYQEQGRFEDAADCYDRTLELSPNSAGGHSNRATLMLLAGDFENGWPEYEWRWKTGQLQLREYPQPRWDGQPLGGKTVILHSEQGLGDTIQFIRYATAVEALGGTVVVECPKSLVKLLANCPGIDRLVGQGDELPPFDFYAPLLSLPGVFKTTLDTIPAHVPYLFADRTLVDEWREKLSGIDGFRIGINWHGRAGQMEFRKRNIPLEFFAALAKIPGVRLVSLQMGEGCEDLVRKCGSLPILELGPDFDAIHGSFMDTSAVMMNLDLVITSDTSIPHLAGALGVPVWLALPFVPDWRWLLQRSDSPWYPTMRVFRQKKIGDWAGVFEEIEGALRERVQIPYFKVQR